MCPMWGQCDMRKVWPAEVLMKVNRTIRTDLLLDSVLILNFSYCSDGCIGIL